MDWAIDCPEESASGVSAVETFLWTNIGTRNDTFSSFTVFLLLGVVGFSSVMLPDSGLSGGRGNYQ